MPTGLGPKLSGTPLKLITGAALCKSCSGPVSITSRICSYIGCNVYCNFTVSIRYNIYPEQSSLATSPETTVSLPEGDTVM